MQRTDQEADVAPLQLLSLRHMQKAGEQVKSPSLSMMELSLRKKAF
jgi:hypothetical protein